MNAEVVIAPPLRGHIRGFDGLRGIAIGLVLAFHLLRYADLSAEAGLAGLLSDLVHSGGIGVDLFFVLSGFLITEILVEGRRAEVRFGPWFWRFAVRRALRILPPYLLFVGVAFLLAPPDPVFAGIPWYVYFTHPLPLQNWWIAAERLGPPITDITWSLAIEEQFYFFWPLAVWWTSPQGLKRVAVGAIVVACVSRPVVHAAFGGWAVHHLTFTRMDGLAAGALAYTLWAERSPGALRWAGLAAAPLVLLLVAVHAWGVDRMSFGYALLGYPLGTLTFASVLLLVRDRQAGAAANLLELPLLAAAGRSAYGLYLWHRLAIAWALGFVGAASASYLVLALASTLLLTAASHRYERWCMSFRDRLAPHPRSAGETTR